MNTNLVNTRERRIRSQNLPDQNEKMIRNTFAKKTYLPAGFTLEAAVIVPLSMVIMASLLLLSFFIHDQIILQTTSVSAIFDSLGKDLGPADIRNAVIEELDAGIIMAHDYNAEVTNKDDEFSISCSAGFDWMFRLLKDFFAGLDSMETSVNISNLDGRRILLKYKILNDAVSLLQDTETQKDD